MQEESSVIKGGGGLAKVFKQFIDMEPTSMLIRGLPGTGKTTLTLELINLMHERYNCFYISTRVSFAKLQRYHPWIIGLINENSLLSHNDANNAAIDLRLGSASGTMELVLDIITNKKKALIVLDSWDSLVNYTKKDERVKMERTMVTVADTHDAFLIFVSEEPEFNTISYVVDGIVTLSMEEYSNTRIRKMRIDKMRGVAINNPTYLYTLLNARFTVLSTLHEYRCYSNRYARVAREGKGEEGRREEVKEKKREYVYTPTWSADLDNLLDGGFRNGSSILVEVDPMIDEQFILSVLAEMVARNRLDVNKCIMISDTVQRPLSRIIKYLNCSYANDIILLTDNERTFKSKAYASYDIDTFFNRYEEYAKQRSLIMLDHSIIERYDLNKIASMINAIKDDGNVVVIIADATISSSLTTKSFTDMHMKFMLLENVPLLHITKPYLGLFGISYYGSYSHIKVV